MMHGPTNIKNRTYLFVTKVTGSHTMTENETPVHSWQRRKLRMPSVVTLKMREHKVIFIISYCGINVGTKATKICLSRVLKLYISNASLSVQMSIWRSAAYRHTESQDMLIYVVMGVGVTGRGKYGGGWTQGLFCTFLVDTMTYVSLHVIVILKLEFISTEVGYRSVPTEYYLSLPFLAALFC